MKRATDAVVSGENCALFQLHVLISASPGDSLGYAMTRGLFGVIAPLAFSERDSQIDRRRNDRFGAETPEPALLFSPSPVAHIGEFEQFCEEFSAKILDVSVLHRHMDHRAMGQSCFFPPESYEGIEETNLNSQNFMMSWSFCCQLRARYLLPGRSLLRAVAYKRDAPTPTLRLWLHDVRRDVSWWRPVATSRGRGGADVHTIRV